MRCDLRIAVVTANPDEYFGRAAVFSKRLFAVASVEPGSVGLRNGTIGRPRRNDEWPLSDPLLCRPIDVAVKVGSGAIVLKKSALAAKWVR
jgi:hypothetical protein